MSDETTGTKGLADVRLSRRQILQVGLMVPTSAAILAACSPAAVASPSAAPSSAPSTAASAPAVSASAVAASPAAAAEDFAGITVNVACNPTNLAHAVAAGPLWEAKTGGKLVATLVPYAERALKFAADIVNQSPNFDLYFASKDFVAQFGSRLYVPIEQLDLDTTDFVPITLKQLANNGKTLALPLFADQEMFIYNQDDWTAAGLDPKAVPTTWDEMYALTPKLTALKGGKLEANATPVLLPSTSYWLCYYNSFNQGFISDDYTQVLFDNDQGVATWDAINKGLTSGFYGKAGLNAASDLDGYLLFNQGLAASEIGIVNGLGQAQSGNAKDFKATIAKTAAAPAVMPGINAGTTGSIIVTEGWGVGAFSKNPKAAASFLKFITGPEYQPKMLDEFAGPGTLLPPSRLSVLSDPAVVAKYPFTKILATQAQGQLQWPGLPYGGDMDKVFGAAFSNLAKGTWTPKQANDETVKSVKDLIVKYLTS